MKSSDFYDRNADAFYADTVTTDMERLYEEFLPLIKPGGEILDAGCGSGRDTLAFIQRGYNVDAFDGSAEMARRASDLTGIPVKHTLFEEFIAAPMLKRYDGIWCCASLLHLERDVMASVLAALFDTLVSGGVMYLSFKHGNGERIKDGRRFTDLTEESLSQVLASIGQCYVLKGWITRDQRPGRDDMWLNAIIEKTCFNNS